MIISVTQQCTALGFLFHRSSHHQEHWQRLDHLHRVHLGVGVLQAGSPRCAGHVGRLALRWWLYHCYWLDPGFSFQDPTLAQWPDDFPSPAKTSSPSLFFLLLPGGHIDWF